MFENIDGESMGVSENTHKLSEKIPYQFFSKIKRLMRNMGLLKAEAFIRSMGLVRLLNTLRARKLRRGLHGGENDFSRFYREHEQEYKAVESMLADDFSKETYRTVIEFRKSYDIDLLKKIIVQPQYFLKDILKPSPEGDVFIDGGAYIGDTALDFFNKFTPPPSKFTFKCRQHGAGCYFLCISLGS